ncbi:RNA polymerase subunit sigma-70 [Pediococcus acidilactici]|uniref:ArpU family phage packaging/lysis transcriptional regulator n=1 Tax=Pediococcus acidilactici TaxID=1254 RepID=UPI001911CA5D|nr:ArpU family phage packaging/lysis transcriptional regulator [Pediococcus acidilactici]QQP82656.1 RNA polymerase subunit sigma-70 [Pediococcus acidilactici]
MSLLPELDDEKTIKNVKRFFEKEFPTLQNMAHISFVDVKSPVISGMPVVHGTDNGSETKSTLHIYAKNVLHKIITACGGLDWRHRKILELRCFKELTWLEIYEVTGYGKTRAQELLNESFLQFAWAFADVDDLRVFKSEHLATN